MKAILVNEDRSLRWDDVPDPLMQADECLVKIEATALNRADLMQREGDYPPPPGAPEWMGLEIAGTITDIGEEAAKHSNWQVGDRVCALLGGEVMGKCICFLNHGARWIMIAALAGQMTQVDLKNIYVRNVRIIGSTLRSRTPQMKAFILSSLVEKVWPKVEAGEVKPTIYKVLPIEEAEAAQDILYRGENVGKVVLTVQ